MTGRGAYLAVVAVSCGMIACACGAAGQTGEVFSASGVRTSAQRNGTNRTTVITSDRLTFDYGKKYGIFEDNVRVSDGEVTIAADRMEVFFADNDDVKTIVAAGSVRMTQLDRVATCSTAVCDVAEGTIVLTGKAEIRRAAEVMRGDRIRITRDPGYVECEPAYLRFQSGTGVDGLGNFMKEEDGGGAAVSGGTNGRK